jgi:F-type H+-transporting ATPase subunit gamma
LFKACAESLASENASRLAVMQGRDEDRRAFQDLTRAFHHMRRSAIDEEVFDIVSEFEALKD